MNDVPGDALRTAHGVTTAGTDERLIVAAATDYAMAWIDGDAGRMRGCLHPALAKRAQVEPGAPELEESPFDVMTGPAVAERKDVGRNVDVTVLDRVDTIAAARVVTEPFVDLLHLARFGDRWLIVNALYEVRPSADTEGDPEGPLRTLNDYAACGFDRDTELARRIYHPAFAERRAVDPASGALELDEITMDDVLETVRDGLDESGERRWTAEVHCVHGDIASGRVSVAWWDVEHHLARVGDRWSIVNILYRSTWSAS